MPSTIYGIATGKLVDLGIQNIHSQQIPALIKASLTRGQAGMVGEGKNIWPNVHIGESKYLFNSESFTSAPINQPLTIASRGLVHCTLQRHHVEPYYWSWT
jgi:hypothetical protein